MSRTNKLCALILTLLLALSCAAEGTLIDEKDIVETGANYTLVTTSTGDYAAEFQFSARVEYPVVHEIVYRGAPARFESSNMKRSMAVKKGDVLMTFRGETDELAEYETELALTRAIEDRTRVLDGYDSEIKELEDAAAREENALLSENLLLNAEIRRIERKRYLASADANIASLQEKLAQIREQGSVKTVYAPCDGIISSLEYFRTKETVTDGTLLAVMYDPQIILLSADGGANLRYGMSVDVTMGSNTDRLSCKATVVAGGGIVPDAGTQALLCLDDYSETAPENLNRPTLTCRGVYIGGIVTVEPKAVSLESGKNYVYKLGKNGMVSKRMINYVTAPTGSRGWILLGAESGETLVVY